MTDKANLPVEQRWATPDDTDWRPGRFFIYKDGELRGAENLSEQQQKLLKEKGYELQPA